MSRLCVFCATSLVLLSACSSSKHDLDRLVSDAQALSHRTYARPTHVDAPLPGTFGAGLEPTLATARSLLPEYRKLFESGDKPCHAAEALDGDPPAACLDFVRRFPLEALLHATHRQEGGVTQEIRALEGPDDQVGADDLMAFIAAAHAAQLRALELRRAGLDEAAAEVCVDTFALGRDASYGRGLLGAMIGVSVLEIAMDRCGTQLAKLAERSHVRDQLKAVRGAIPSLREALVEERVVVALRVFGALLDEARRAALPPNGAVSPYEQKPSWLERRQLAKFLPSYLRRTDVLVASAELAAPERRARIAAVDREIEASGNLLASIAEPDFDSYIQRRDDAVAHLDAILSSLEKP